MSVAMSMKQAAAQAFVMGLQIGRDRSWEIFGTLGTEKEILQRKRAILFVDGTVVSMRKGIDVSVHDAIGALRSTLDPWPATEAL